MVNDSGLCICAENRYQGWRYYLKEKAPAILNAYTKLVSDSKLIGAIECGAQIEHLSGLVWVLQKQGIKGAQRYDEYLMNNRIYERYLIHGARTAYSAGIDAGDSFVNHIRHTAFDMNLASVGKREELCNSIARVFAINPDQGKIYLESVCELKDLLRHYCGGNLPDYFIALSENAFAKSGNDGAQVIKSCKEIFKNRIAINRRAISTY